MRISPELVQNKLDAVPEDVREQVTSEEVAQTLTEIGKSHALHIDQQGILDEETLYIMLGVENPDNFIGTLQNRLGIDEGKAISIARDINEKVFLRIRQSLMAMHEEEKEAEEAPAPAPTSAPAQATAPSLAPQIPQPAPEDTSAREDILADIENPTRAVHPISAADQGIPRPAPKTEITPEDKATAANFIAGKLSQTVSVPPQKAVFEEKKASEKPKGYSTDPYREPLN